MRVTYLLKSFMKQILLYNKTSSLTHTLVLQVLKVLLGAFIVFEHTCVYGEVVVHLLFIPYADVFFFPSFWMLAQCETGQNSENLDCGRWTDEILYHSHCWLNLRVRNNLTSTHDCSDFTSQHSHRRQQDTGSIHHTGATNNIIKEKTPTSILLY